jgi:transcriptional regulator with XRE-family HTH domain
MTEKLSRNKRKTLGVRIKPKEGLWIRYQLNLKGITLSSFAERQGVRVPTVSKTIHGLTKSARIESAIYETLGFDSFETMIAAARGKGATV